MTGLNRRKIERLQNYIAGQWVDPAPTRYEEVYNPATEEVLAKVPFSGRADVDAAVQAAAEAFPAWSATPVVERARIMFRFQHLLFGHQDELARSITTENGKNINEASAEVLRGIEMVEFAAGMPTLMMGDALPNIARGIDGETIRLPLGVVGGIVPFNFPLMVPMWMYPVALTAGNTFVLKPSERAPLSSMRAMDLLREAGLPAGVINLVHGAHEVVNGLLEHPQVKAISFVGSEPVAEYIYKTAAANGKRVQALAGAKNHHLVLADADLRRAAKTIVSSAFGSAGERCMAASAVVVVAEVADRLMSLLLEEAAALKMGQGLEKGVDLGPVIRANHLERVHGRIEKGLAAGATLVRDGRQDARAFGQGYFLGPTIFDDCHPDMEIVREEIFAPVLSVMRVKDFEEGLDTIRMSRFGNGATIYTRSGYYAREFVLRAEAGMIGVNVGVPAPMGFFPFSGSKRSFFGDLHVNGKDGVEFYTRKKTITARWFAEGDMGIGSQKVFVK
ncbi:methylmalonate-semialdehyde dehydrogenase (acylating)/malonate-semialdehyde dehydrogenase (acetylating) [Acididesulfobacillus acetoxydans]|uniref:methylmalonate-semialdehyde dehydrogenase (CoA acylating) n=1 Tax=Acididesulfobacillus acetoxydans TaxID=1561005 RepID=A0A8S0Y2B4_9FIRM|nr:methylmalonate-semialdehyde dehydrogenase (acylating)/malonate-semialdehyde dehydrogenase (acetylating) [Acididesulfobacillus acetoxydans]CEJ06709.1 Methylmalonate semialdehyde dehydrogenase [acylating] 1 [Acididesulfobacillus acetoxydans]